MTDPQGTADLVRSYILDGVDVVSNLVGETVTGGRLNAFNSVSIAMNNCNSDMGCMDPNACNYNPEAIEDNGSCQYYDDCMVCGGDNTILLDVQILKHVIIHQNTQSMMEAVYMEMV